MRFRTHGGARKNAGRHKKGLHAIRHDKRARVSSSVPLHVVIRVEQRVGNLRRPEMYAAIREATMVVARHDELRIVHASVQATHLHLIVEAASGGALTTGMRSFLISAAMQLNGALSARRGVKCRGPVFERYHARPLATPRQIRTCVAYVLNNWRHHGEHRKVATARWLVDRYSSAVSFDGWKQLGAGARDQTPPDHDPLVVWTPRAWLLTTGWLRHGLVSVYEVPGGDE
jgi:REP element-mobilizing transposase RayT